jgi:hypothetical protein
MKDREKIIKLVNKNDKMLKYSICKTNEKKKLKENKPN